MKICNIEGCENGVWGNGICKFHTHQKPLARRLLQPTRSITRHSKPKDDINIHLMQNFFKTVWNNKRNHICEECGERLGKEPLSYYFDHILEKSKYPDLKFEEDNIQYLCLHCHDRKSRGFLSEKTLEKIRNIKNKYNIFD